MFDKVAEQHRINACDHAIPVKLDPGGLRSLLRDCSDRQDQYRGELMAEHLSD
jgi:hypothetical protein